MFTASYIKAFAFGAVRIEVSYPENGLMSVTAFAGSATAQVAVLHLLLAHLEETVDTSQFEIDDDVLWLHGDSSSDALDAAIFEAMRVMGFGLGKIK